MTLIIFAILFIVFEGIIISSFKRFSPEYRNTLYGWIVFFQLFFLAGFRNVNIYNDSLAYASHFININPKSIFDINIDERFEYGYQILESFIHFAISDSPLALFIVTSLIIQGSIIYFFRRYSRALWISILFYIGLRFYFFSVSGIRQALAVAIFCFAYPFLEKGKLLWYFLLILIAAQFHNSAYVLFLLPLLQNFTPSYKKFILGIIITIIIYFFLDNFSNLYFSYTTYGNVYLKDDWISDSKIGIWFILITNIFLFVFLIKKFEFNNHTISEKNGIIFIFIVLIVQLLSIKISQLNRFSYYFLPIIIVAASNSCSKIKKVKLRIVTFTFWIIFLITQLVVILIYRPGWYTIVPYKLYWQ